MTAIFPPPQSPLQDIRWRGRGQLDLLGVSFASLKEQVDNEVGSAGVRREGRGWLAGDHGRLSHPDPTPCSGGSDCSKRPSSSRIHYTGDAGSSSTPRALSGSWAADPQPEFWAGGGPCMWLRLGGSGYNVLQPQGRGGGGGGPAFGGP